VGAGGGGGARGRAVGVARERAAGGGKGGGSAGASGGTVCRRHLVGCECLQHGEELGTLKRTRSCTGAHQGPLGTAVVRARLGSSGQGSLGKQHYPGRFYAAPSLSNVLKSSSSCILSLR
jgi:hypothetical protein